MPEFTLANEVCAGFCAGSIGTVFGYPFDVVKTRMQASQVSGLSAMRLVHQQSGIAGFYVGISSPLLALTMLNTINFSLYNHFCTSLSIRNETKTSRFAKLYGIAGGLVGPFAAMISTPFELIKMQLQLQSKLSGESSQTKTVHGLIGMTRHILQEHGFSKLYRGHVVNIIREMVFLSTYFMVYENIKEILKEQLSLGMKIAVPLAGGISGATGWLISFPLDNIKTNIQGIALNKTPEKAIDIAKRLLREKGIRGLYFGVAPSVMRSFIVSATRFSVYESAMHALISYRS